VRIALDAPAERDDRSVATLKPESGRSWEGLTP
jgi:hypothetical protein